MKVRPKTLFLNEDTIKNNPDVLILITWPMLKFLLMSKDVLYQVSSDLIKGNSFYSSFSDAAKKAPLPFKSSKKPGWHRVKKLKLYKNLFQKHYIKYSYQIFLWLFVYQHHLQKDFLQIEHHNYFFIGNIADFI